jgi:hypothetical protein
LEKNSQEFFDLPNLEKDEARRGNVGFRENRELKPLRGALRGGGTCHKWGMGASAPIIYLSV